MLTVDEQEEIGQELELLFKAQGKKLDDDLKLVFLNEMKRWPFMPKQIIAGIRSMIAMDLKVIRPIDIRRILADNSAKNTVSGTDEFQMSDEERSANLLKILNLKKVYGSHWWRHFDDAEETNEYGR